MISDHAWILENLAAYLSGGLEPPERERLEQHTAECVPCAAALNDVRSLDLALSGLFVEARPSAVLEDRVIQALRNRPPNGWLLPVPAWLPVAAAALVLIGFTGAVASQVLVHGGLSFTETSEAPAQTSFMADYITQQAGAAKDVDGLAQASRERALSELDRAGPLLQENNQLGFRIPKKKLSAPDSSRIFTSTLPSNETFEDKTFRGNFSRPPKDSRPLFDKDSRPLFDQDAEHSQMPTAGPASATDGTQLNPFQPRTQLNDSLPLEAMARKAGEVKSGGKLSSGTGSGGGQGQERRSEVLKEKEMQNERLFLRKEDANSPQSPEKKPQAQASPRKIVIRTGEIEYEVQSFDAAVATITRLVKNIKGGFLATVNSDKLANGKVRGSVVVRVPPENLDELILELRTNLSKSGELKNQRIGSQDITKQYTDMESELRAARAMEERLLQIIKTGKGEIKDLLAVEKELGSWRTRIEKIEGELRYYANQVALSTLTILLYEKEITAPFAVIEREQVQMGIEVEDVDQAYQAAQKAVREAKGRITRAELKQPSQGQFTALLHFEVAPEAAGPLRDRLKQLGTVARFDIARQEESEGGAGKPSDGKTKRSDTRFQVHFYNLWALGAATARETDELQLACADVAASYRGIQEAVLKVKGRVLNAQLNEQDRRQVTAMLDFEVRRADEDAVRAALMKAGAVYTRKVSRAADNGNVVDSKLHWQVAFLNQANIPPRETYKFGVEVADVDQTAAMLSALAGQRDGRTVESSISRERSGQVVGKLIYDVPMAEVHQLLDALKATGTVRVQESVKHPEVPDSSLAIARIDVTLSNTALLVPSDDGVGPSVRKGLSDSFAVLSWSLRFLILGLCVLLPWALVIWAIYRLVVRLRRRTTPSTPAA
ncbi:MAG: DUF4349 domain-containing protein [Gemmataceae bacterium]